MPSLQGQGPWRKDGTLRLWLSDVPLLARAAQVARAYVLMNAISIVHYAVTRCNVSVPCGPSFSDELPSIAIAGIPNLVLALLFAVFPRWSTEKTRCAKQSKCWHWLFRRRSLGKFGLGSWCNERPSLSLSFVEVGLVFVRSVLVNGCARVAHNFRALGTHAA
jgi:hypothetical protein